MWKLDINQYDDELIEYESIIGALADNRLVSFVKEGDMFIIVEQCDNYFTGKLTKEQLLGLAAELVALANS